MSSRIALGPTSQEFESTQNNWWEPDVCKHCGEERMYHWQTRNGVVWCTDWKQPETQEAGQK